MGTEPKVPNDQVEVIRLTNDHGNHNPVLSSFMIYHLVSNKSNAMGVTSGAETAYPSGVSEFTPAFQWGSCCSIFSCRSNGLQNIVFPFCLFFSFVIVFSVLLRFAASN